MSHSQEATPLVVHGLPSSQTTCKWCTNVAYLYTFIIHPVLHIKGSVYTLGVLCTPLKNIGRGLATLPTPMMKSKKKQ